jgi:hypothetical protein
VYSSGYPKSVNIGRVSGEQWNGYGTALKPSHEAIVLARESIEGTVAGNCLKHGCGALWIDGCRVGIDGGTGTVPTSNGEYKKRDACDAFGNERLGRGVTISTGGRFPANLLHDGSEEVMAEFAKVGNLKSGSAGKNGHLRRASLGKESTVNVASRKNENAGMLYGDSGTPARFFYNCAEPAEGDDNIYNNGIGKVRTSASNYPDEGTPARYFWSPQETDSRSIEIWNQNSVNTAENPSSPSKEPAASALCTVATVPENTHTYERKEPSTNEMLNKSSGQLKNSISITLNSEREPLPVLKQEEPIQSNSLVKSVETPKQTDTTTTTTNPVKFAGSAEGVTLTNTLNNMEPGRRFSQAGCFIAPRHRSLKDSTTLIPPSNLSS